MGSRSIILLIATGLVSLARADLQLTPSLSDYEVDGVKFKQLAFPDGGKRVTYQPPPEWEYIGSANQLTLHPRGKSQVEATVTKVNSPEPASFDAEGQKKLVTVARGLVPKENTDVTVISQEKNPLQVSGKETFQVVLSYKSTGQTFNRSILFLNRGSDQIRFQFVAREKDFKRLQQEFQSSLCSWQNL